MVAHMTICINKALIALDHIGKDVLPGIHPGSYMVKTLSNSMRIGRTIKNIPYTEWQKARPDPFLFLSLHFLS